MSAGSLERKIQASPPQEAVWAFYPLTLRDAGLRGEEDSEELDIAENHFELNTVVEPHKNRQGEL